MDKSFKYFAPLVIPQGRANRNVGKWQESLKYHTEGQYAPALNSLMQYYKPELTTLQEGQEVELKHGSLTLYLRWENDRVYLKAPFLRLGEPASAALLRKLSEMNMNELTLSQIRLEEDLLFYEYDTPMDLTHPSKMAELFREICMSGDYYDDLFAEKFKAHLVHESPLKPLSENTRKASYEAIQVILKEAIAYADHFNSKRQTHFAIDAASIGLYHVIGAVEPQGYVSSLVGQTINQLFSRGEPGRVLEDFKKNCNKILDLSEEKLSESLYEAEFFLPLLKVCSVKDFQNICKGALQQAEHERKQSDYVGSTLSLLRVLHDVLYRYDVPDMVRTPVTAMLAAASEQPWQVASDILYTTLQPLMNEQFAAAGEMAEQMGRAS